MNILTVSIAYPSIINEVNGIFVKDTVKCVSKFNNMIVLACTIIENESKIKASIYETEEDGIRVIRVFIKKTFLPEMILSTIGIFKGLKYIKKMQKKIDIVHAHFFASAIPFLVLMKDKPLIISEYSSVFTFGQLSRIAIFIAKRVMKKSKVVLVGSEFLTNNIKSFGINANFKKCLHPVDTSLFYHVNKNPSQKIRILLVSRLVKVKKISILIHALGLVKKSRTDFYLDIIGDGPDAQEYFEEVNLLGLKEFIKFHGYQEKNIILKFLQECDFFVLPSTTENQPVVLNEAMCCGKPVLVTRGGGNPEVVNSKVGMLIEPDNIESLKEGLLTMMDNYQKFNSSVIEKYGNENYSYEVVGKKLENLYTEIINKMRWSEG